MNRCSKTQALAYDASGKNPMIFLHTRGDLPCGVKIRCSGRQPCVIQERLDCMFDSISQTYRSNNADNELHGSPLIVPEGHQMG